MLTREEQIKVVEQQIEYLIKRMRSFQDAGNFDSANALAGNLANVATALQALSNCPPYRFQAPPLKPERPKVRMLDLGPDQPLDDDD